MTSMGVREFKGRLSQHLRRVQLGVSLTITDRGRPIAVLSPVKRVSNLAWAHEMVAKGQATWSGGKPVGLNPRIRAKGTPLSQMILEDRE